MIMEVSLNSTSKPYMIYMGLSVRTSVKNPQANAILEQVHQVIMTMLCTAEIDMADTVAPSDIDTFLSNASWAICSTYHTVLIASPGAAIFGCEMLFDIPYIADWNKIGDYRQCQTDLNTSRESKQHVDYDYKVGDRVLVWKDGILCKTEVGMTVNHGPSRQFIRMEQSGLNAEPNQKG
jgi:hypothetical protein